MGKDQLTKNRHSLAHILAMAVLKKDPNAKLAIGPAIDTGFYYDFELTNPLSIEDLPWIEDQMKELIKEGLSFKGTEVTAEKAKKIFQNQPYKLDLIEEFIKDGKKLTTYESGSFVDLCAGGHIENTKDISPDSFALDKLAGAYWRGSENNQMLTRIYGLAFETKEKLETYKKQKEEAEKRDHRKLGRELDLFCFSPLVGAGLPLFTPKGTFLRDMLDNLVWTLRKRCGYERVDIPHITKKELYETSGHWEKFGNELFSVQSREGHSFVLKPMNCPHHTQIYSRKIHSYKELPIRYSNTTKVYRDEQTGELTGLSRVRSITQDDAHVFARSSQIKNEIANVWDMIKDFYHSVGFENITATISTHDSNNFNNYLGKEENWEKCVKTLREVAKEKGQEDLKEFPGEAAFYGPKLDFIATDSLDREWQVATIQLDMNLPERFNLTCTNEKGEQERIVMLHVAIMGSLERFLSVYIEHTGGNFPLWLSPVQVAILPITDNHKKYAQDISEKLEGANIRVELYDENETLGKKIRSVKEQKVPYFIVIGDKEVGSKTIKLEPREGGAKEVKVDQLVETLQQEVTGKN